MTTGLLPVLIATTTSERFLIAEDSCVSAPRIIRDHGRRPSRDGCRTIRARLITPTASADGV